MMPLSTMLAALIEPDSVVETPASTVKLPAAALPAVPTSSDAPLARLIVPVLDSCPTVSATPPLP
jgi:hypothetical protein